MYVHLVHAHTHHTHTHIPSDAVLRRSLLLRAIFLLRRLPVKLNNRFITKDADSKWRALRRRGDPGIDIPDSLPRITRVGSLPRKKGTVPFVHPEPERGLPYGVRPSEPCIKTGARWAGQAEGASSLVSIYPRIRVLVYLSMLRSVLTTV